MNGWMAVKVPNKLKTDDSLKSKLLPEVPSVIAAYNKLGKHNSAKLRSAMFDLATWFADSNSEWYLDLIRVHGLNSFSKEDFEEKQFNNRKLLSLVEQVYLKIAKILEQRNTLWSLMVF